MKKTYRLNQLKIGLWRTCEAIRKARTNEPQKVESLTLKYYNLKNRINKF